MAAKPRTDSTAVNTAIAKVSSHFAALAIIAVKPCSRASGDTPAVTLRPRKMFISGKMTPDESLATPCPAASIHTCAEAALTAFPEAASMATATGI